MGADPLGGGLAAPEAAALLQIALVVVLRRVEHRRGLHLRDAARDRGDGGLRRRLLRGGVEVDAAAVLSAHVAALPVQRRRVVLVEEHLGARAHVSRGAVR